METIIGVVVSLFVQGVKRWSPNEWVTLSVVLGASILAAILYNTLSVYEVGWENFVAILTSAGAFYTFILKRF